MKRHSHAARPARSASSRATARGAYVNTAEANCSIFESGRMVFRCLADSSLYELDYYSLDDLDIELFNRDGTLRRRDGSGLPAGDSYDFYVFNWHFITMASLVQPDAIARLKSPKLTVVLELAPDDPLKLVPPRVFDGFIALDPNAEESDSIVAFPRPLELAPWTGARADNPVPVIASFGFGTPGKGFELLVEAVNREFERAVVRINIPTGSYVATDVIHNMSYSARIADVCTKIAKPGIEVRLTNDYMTPDELVSWCAGNDLNCFMYTRAQPGLSATTDQCIISGQPLVTLTNDTFRHIHRYIPPYPMVGLRQAMETTVERVADIQTDWSREAFRNTFHRMLAGLGVVGDTGHSNQMRALEQSAQRILVLSTTGAQPGNILNHAQKVVDALGRSGNRTVLHAEYGALETLAETIAAFQPTCCVLVGATLDHWVQIGPLIEHTVTGPKILISDQVGALRKATGGAGTFLLPHLPLVPFHTTYIKLLEPRSIWLIGFSANIPALRATIEKLQSEVLDVDIIVEVPAAERTTFENSLASQQFWRSRDSHFRIRLESGEGLDNLHSMAASSLIIVHNEPARSAELEAYACLGMVTERPVVFTRHGVFPQFLGRGTYFEDQPTEDLFELGVAAHIKPYYDFGEWTFAATILRLLDGSWKKAVPAKADAVVVALDPIECLQIAAIGTGAKVEPPPPLVVPPAPLIGDLATVLRQRGQGSTVLLLAGVIDKGAPRPSRFVVSLRETWRARGETVQVVLWNASTRRLHLLSDDQWMQWSGSATKGPLAIGADSTPVLLEPLSCGPEDWLLIPEAMTTQPGAYPLLSTNIVLEARRLKINSAFVFHGAGPLAAHQGGTQVKDDHTHYMQALLLADLILPVSDTAADDLQDFFVDSELADVVPRIKTVAWDATRYQNARQWAEYVRLLRAHFTDATDPARRLPKLYYLLPEDQAPRSDRAFAETLADALIARGVTLVPTRWQAAPGIMVSASPSDEQCAGWGAWTAPGSSGAPSWLLVPYMTAGEELAKLRASAQAAGLRVAGLLTSVEPGSEKSDFDALSGLDKVLAGSANLYDSFYRHLLASPNKVLSAEDRFRRLDLPTERPEPRAVAPRLNRTRIVRALVHVTTENPTELRSLFAVMTQAVRLSPQRMKPFFIAGANVAKAVRDSALEAALAAMPGARWEVVADARRRDELLGEADFLVHAGPGGIDADAVRAGLWRGLPCLVLRDGAALPDYAGAGVVCANLQHPAAATAEVLKLGDAEWRRTLANEALARPTRTFQAYAEDLLELLATDRLADGLTPAKRSDKPHIQTRLPGLAPRPKLSVCISTYNRGGWVALSLRNIFRQIPHPRADLEVLVVDNTSTDDTEELVQPFLSRPDFRYVRNPRNVGLLGNLAVTSQQARGEYFWILGDDDLTRDGTIERVLGIINAHPKIELIYMNYGYSSEKDPGNVTDLPSYLDNFNYLEPAGPDEVASIHRLASKSENFYTAIYAMVYRRDHGMRTYCQDTSERVFSSMLSCIPSSYYTLHYMADLKAYWMGEPALVVNSNVSWQAYGTLFDLEQLPRTWDLAERLGCPPDEVDRRRSNRLWLIELMWRELFEDDRAGNAPYLSAPRIIMRLKHLEGFRKHVPALRDIYAKAYRAGHPAARLAPETLFSFPW